MATNKNTWLADAIGTMRDFWRIGSAGVRLKNVAGVLQVRNAGDTADANMKAALLQLSGGSPGAGKVLTSDASGNATWQTPEGAIGGILPTSAYWIPPQMKMVSVEAWGAFNIDATYLNAGTWGTTLQNAENSIGILLAAGNYTLWAYGARYSGGGDVTLYMDGVSKGVQVGYSAATVKNFKYGWTLSGVTAGLHTFTTKVESKQAASSGYNFFISAFYIQET